MHPKEARRFMAAGNGASLADVRRSDWRYVKGSMFIEGACIVPKGSSWCSAVFVGVFMLSGNGSMAALYGETNWPELRPAEPLAKPI